MASRCCSGLADKLGGNAQSATSVLPKLRVAPTPCSFGRKDVRRRVVALLLASTPTDTAATVHVWRTRDPLECSSRPHRAAFRARAHRLGHGSVQIRRAGEH